MNKCLLYKLVALHHTIIIVPGELPQEDFSFSDALLPFSTKSTGMLSDERETRQETNSLSGFSMLAIIHFAHEAERPVPSISQIKSYSFPRFNFNEAGIISEIWLIWCTLDALRFRHDLFYFYSLYVSSCFFPSSCIPQPNG